MKNFAAKLLSIAKLCFSDTKQIQYYLFSCFFLVSCQKSTTLAPGEVAPEISGATTSDEVYELNQEKNQSKLGTLVVFMASWCEVCLEELPNLVNLSEKTADKLNIVAVAVNDTKQAMTELVVKYRVNFPVIIDQDNKIAKKFQVTGVPEAFLLDKSLRLTLYSDVYGPTVRITGARSWNTPQTIQSIFETLDPATNR